MLTLPQRKLTWTPKKTQVYEDSNELPTSLKKTVPMKICCIEIEKKKENATAQKQECGCPSLQPSLRIHTHAFFANAPASLIIKC